MSSGLQADHLGGHYPYFHQSDPDQSSPTLSALLQRLPPDHRVLDAAGVCEILGRRFLLGDRTLIQGVRRWPWLARRKDSAWDFLDPPRHGQRRAPPEAIAQQLIAGLSSELASRLSGVARVGLLLSGGMDSRVVASVLDRLQRNNEYVGEVTAITWGIEGARDVEYARQIARRMRWAFQHIPLDASVLRSNFHLAARLGAEVSPFHLHGMDTAAGLDDIDAFVAGSYGDMVGRAEFASRHVLNLRPILPRSLNPFGLMRRDVVAATRAAIQHDVTSIRRRVSCEHEFQYRELEHHAHYTRRLLSGAMNAISARARLHQAFTSPQCYGGMWSVDPALRDDRVYAVLLRSLPRDLLEIPWARTGLPYGTVPNGSAPDPRPKHFHRYGPWAREELRPFITELVLSPEVRRTGLFNEMALRRLLKTWTVARTISVNHIDENIAWLATLALFLRRYDINSVSHSMRLAAVDRIHGLAGPARAWMVGRLRNRVRA